MPATKYAVSGDLRIAYQVVGEGSRDLVYVPGWVSNIEVMWEDPGLARFLNRLASFSRLIVFDKRGTGLSDGVEPDALPSLEVRMDDLRAVMDAVGSDRATLFGHSEGGNMCILFAATFPERTDGIVLFGSYAKRLRSEDYPWAPTWEDRVRGAEQIKTNWIDPDAVAEFYAPSRVDDSAFRVWLERYLRLSASPKAAAALNMMNTMIDVTTVLPAIGVPTLLLYRVDDPDVNIEEGRYIASKVPEARLVELSGGDHFFWAGDTGPILEEIEEFVTGHRVIADPDRALVTVLFTDIVGSTAIAAQVGDGVWRDVLARHEALVRQHVRKWRGRIVKTIGDGFMASFDGPARAIRCALAIVEATREAGLEVRAGIHTGEAELIGNDLGGIAVHIGSRIAALAADSEVLVSRTVSDLVAGSGIDFDERGDHTLKGVPGTWRLYAVVPT